MQLFVREVPTLDPLAVGRRIAAARRARAWKQRDLADAVGVAKPTVCQWETGRCLPSLRMLAGCAFFLRRSTDFLIFGTAKRGALWR